MEAVDTFIPQPERPKAKPFLSADRRCVLDLGPWHHRRWVASNVASYQVNEEVEIVGLKPTTKTVVTGVEMFRKLLDQGEAGDNIGALLRGTKREEVERGQVLAKPGSITPHTKFKAECYIRHLAMKVAVIRRSSPTIALRSLLPHDGRHWRNDACRLAQKW